MLVTSLVAAIKYLLKQLMEGGVCLANGSRGCSQSWRGRHSQEVKGDEHWKLAFFLLFNEVYSSQWDGAAHILTR